MSEFDDQIDDDTLDWIDREGPSNADIERFGSETAPCRHCGVDIYDDATHCQACGRPVQSSSKPSWWIYIAGFATLLALLLLSMGGLP